MVAQLAIIVAGVLIALLAQALWNDRQDHSREQDYLEQLRSDLAITRTRMIQGIAAQDSALHRMSRMIQAMRSAGEPPPNDSVAKWSRATVSLYWQPVTGTVRALMRQAIFV